jgi:uncharacterized membrane protein
MTVEFLILRFVHVVGGTFWVGSALFTTWFLMPALLGAGPAVAGPVFGQLAERRMMIVMPVVAVLTILSGLRLMMIVSDNFSGAYFATSSGRAFAVAAVAALLAFLLGMLVARPSAMRAGRLSAAIAGAAEAERGALTRQLDAERTRGALASNIAMVLLLIGAGGMALARYL